MMSMGDMGMMTALFMRPLFVMASRLFVMAGGMLMVFSSLLVMLRSFMLWHFVCSFCGFAI